LPEPSIVSGDEVSAALFDPARSADAVVSMLSAAGIAIYRADGSILRHGSGAPGDVWLLESEVRALIAMTEADAASVAAGGRPATLGDLSAAITGMALSVGAD
jgi:hypothetical protein